MAKDTIQTEWPTRKAPRTADFKHLIWRRHPERTSWDGCRPEIIATDGAQVRRLTSQQQYISVQVFDDRNAASDIANKVESSVAEGVALVGYSMFNDNEAVAILHTADGLEPGWVAFPHRRTTSSTIPTLPMRVADMPKLRLVGGAKMEWHDGMLALEGALEQRGQSFANSPFAFNITQHVRGWEVWGRVGHEQDARKLRLVRRGDEPDIRVENERRLVGRFPIDEVIWHEFSQDPSFSVWYVVHFDRELFCLPDDWLKFWMRVEIS